MGYEQPCCKTLSRGLLDPNDFNNQEIYKYLESKLGVDAKNTYIYETLHGSLDMHSGMTQIVEGVDGNDVLCYTLDQFLTLVKVNFPEIIEDILDACILAAYCDDVKYDITKLKLDILKTQNSYKYTKDQESEWLKKRKGESDECSLCMYRPPTLGCLLTNVYLSLTTSTCERNRPQRRTVTSRCS